MVITDSIKERLGDWWPWMQELVESDTWDQLYSYLKAESGKGRVIIPKSAEVWKSLQLCPRDKVKAIILLQCPYATERDMKGKKIQVASGVPLSCENIAPYLQPALQQWYWAIDAQYPFHPADVQDPDINYLLKEGVLLLNTSMTVELNKIDSHQAAWAPVMQWFIENVINKYLNGIPIVLVGGAAQKFEKYLNPMANPLMKVEHPSTASAANKDWKHEDMHLWLDKIITANNGNGYRIRWTKRKGEDNEPVPECMMTSTVPPWEEEVGDLPWNKSK